MNNNSDNLVEITLMIDRCGIDKIEEDTIGRTDARNYATYLLPRTENTYRYVEP
jgi:hypothetical protein